MKNKSFLYFGFLLVLVMQWSCSKENKIADEIANQDVTITIDRFDQKFAEATIQDLTNLKASYPFLFSKNIKDSVWIARMKDPVQLEINDEIASSYGDFSAVNDDVEMLMKHLNFYNQSFRIPKIVTVTNFVDYRNKVIVTDSIVLIALDNFLGKDHKFYQGIPKYLSANFEPSQITVALADAYAERASINPSKVNFLSEMIAEGKKLYYKDLMLPIKTNAQKMGYSDEELKWAEMNEANIWSYFIENELLYKTDPKLTYRFITPAPFSKFELAFDNESPGRVGAYIGWQIVKAYAKNNDTSWEQIMRMPADELFQKSKFKPRK